MSFAIYVLLGAVAGLLAGLLGIGGGLIVVPVLLFVFQENGLDLDIASNMALGTSLASMVVTATGSAYEHNRNRGVRWDLFAYLAVGLAAGSVVGPVLAHGLSGALLTMLIGVFAILMAFQMAFGLKPKPGAAPPSPGLLLIGGALISTVSSMFGIGGGTFTVPFLTWRSVPPQQAVGTSSACGVPISLVGATTYVLLGWSNDALPAWSAGYVYWPAFLGVVLTSPIFARVGARLAYKTPSHVLKRLFAALLVVVGLSLIRESLQVAPQQRAPSTPTAVDARPAETP